MVWIAGFEAFKLDESESSFDVEFAMTTRAKGE